MTQKRRACRKMMNSYSLSSVKCFYDHHTDLVTNSYDMKRSKYDTAWTLRQVYLAQLGVFGPGVERPLGFERLKKIVEKLTFSFPFVRIGFYEKNANYSSEMTFTPELLEPKQILAE